MMIHGISCLGQVSLAAAVVLVEEVREKPATIRRRRCFFLAQALLEIGQSFHLNHFCCLGQAEAVTLERLLLVEGGDPADDELS